MIYHSQPLPDEEATGYYFPCIKPGVTAGAVTERPLIVQKRLDALEVHLQKCINYI